MKKLENKVAMITGCNRGIGRSIMELFMAEGANIIACTRKLTPELRIDYEERAKQFSVQIYPLEFDLKDEDSIRLAMKELYSWKIPVDILVNNAGVASGGYLLMTSLKQLKEVFQVNYFSQVFRLAEPVEIAQVALFLASADSSYITGQIIRVDGGL